ncbi:MAG: glycosyltransferase family 2 protein [Gemmatimonadota bacterium]
MAVAFWVAVGLVAYTYLLYPVLLWALSQARRTPVFADPPEWPSLSLVVSAYNEAGVMAAKLENALGLDYPAGRRQILVVSDGSDDGTDGIAAGYAGRGVELLRLERRSGKTAGQNAAARRATGEILVFSDANSMYRPDALKALVRPFADPRVGCVCGELRYVNPGAGGAAKGEGFYWRYEQFIKRAESRLGSLVGANGSIYALRRDLFEELGPAIISDFIMPIRVVRRGRRVLYEPGAVAEEQSGKRFGEELRRRTRIIARSLYGLWTERGVLNPLTSGAFSLQILSHKVIRWLVPACLLGALGSSAVLAAAGGPFFRVVLGGQGLFYGLAALGALAPKSLGRLSVFYVPAYFTATNLGALLGLIGFLAGRRYAVWQPLERQEA